MQWLKHLNLNIFDSKQHNSVREENLKVIFVSLSTNYCPKRNSNEFIFEVFLKLKTIFLVQNKVNPCS